MSFPVPLTDILASRRGFWLVEIEIGGGEVFRFAREQLTILNEAGDEFVYREGLQRELVLGQNVGADGDSSVPVIIVSDVDWALLRARGIPIERSNATVRRWFTDQTLERARVHLKGSVESATYDRAGAPLQLSITRRPRILAGNTIRPFGRVGKKSWPVTVTFELDDKAGVGASYPTIFGSPGALDDGTTVAAIPVPTCEWRQNNVGTRTLGCLGEIAATSIEMFDYTDDDQPAQDTRPISIIDDLRGITTSTSTVGATLRRPQQGAKYYWGFPAGQRGLLRRDRTAGLIGAGEEIRFIIESHVPDLEFDSGRFAAIEDRLNSWHISGWWNSDVNWWNVIQSEYLPLLPVVEMRGRFGWYLQYIDWAATTDDVVAFFNADTRQVVRQPGVTTTGGLQVPNEITLQFAPSRDSGRFLEEMTITAQTGQLTKPLIGETAADTRIIPSPFARASQGLYGVQQVTRQSQIIWEGSTAALTLRNWAARDTIPRRRFTYIGGPELESIPLWSPIALKDTEMHLDGQVMLLEDLQIGPDEVQATLISLDHPHLTTRSTE